MSLKLKLIATMFAAICFAMPRLVAGDSVSIYFIGNSVTDTVNYSRFKELVTGLGQEIEIGRHTIPGSPLSWTWQHPEGGNWSEEHGPFLEALSNHKWDVLSLQPFDRQLDGGEDSDAEIGARFIREALKGNPGNALRVLVYSRWPRRDSDTALTFYGRSYAEQWERNYSNPSYDGGNETREYFELVREAWKQEFPELRIDLVPVGDVLFQLSEKIDAGEIPKLTAITDLYSDGIHFYDGQPHGNIGSYLVALTFYATIFERSPEGDDSYALWDIDDPDLAKVIQQTVWEVVREQLGTPDSARP